VHSTENDFFVRSAVLEIERFQGDKTGEPLARAIERFLWRYGIWPFNGHITTDGGSDFLSMLRRLDLLLRGFTFPDNGLRCLAHIVTNSNHRISTAMHCEGFESEDIAPDHHDILTIGAERRDLADKIGTELETQNLLLPPGNSHVLAFEIVLYQVRRLVCSLRLYDKSRRALETHDHDTNIKLCVPTLDHLDRWNTAHDMLDELLQPKRQLRLLMLDDLLANDPQMGHDWPPYSKSTAEQEGQTHDGARTGPAGYLGFSGAGPTHD
jgi:hypothetical protein